MIAPGATENAFLVALVGAVACNDSAIGDDNFYPSHPFQHLDVTLQVSDLIVQALNRTLCVLASEKINRMRIAIDYRAMAQNEVKVRRPYTALPHALFGMVGMDERIHWSAPFPVVSEARNDS
ncbi:MAG: hypothetical protein OXF56_14425 [Rhodobacteraceae bacterium]|nr:hypothetical protein [Paracoccaceae bacterium]